VQERLRRLPGAQFGARVLAVFEGACDLITQDGDVMALVLPQIGDGPLNIVLDGTAGLFAGVGPGAPVTLEDTWLRIGGVGVDLGKATMWEPRPDWEALQGRRAAIVAHLPLLRSLCLDHAPDGSLLSLVGTPLRDDGHAGTITSTAREATEALKEGWAGQSERLHEGAAKLAGLGSGLTPAGDDFLTGVMLWAWLAHPTPGLFCQAIAKAAGPRTTTLSAAFLQAAARGECGAPWHGLLAALAEAPTNKQAANIVAALQEILAYGATSGADSLTGFLCCPSL
jgi:hypothetical protein